MDGFLDCDATGRESFFVGGLRVRHVDVEPDGKGGAASVGDHYDGVVDANLGVHDLAVGGAQPAEIGGLKCLLQEVDDALRVVRDDVHRSGIIDFGFPGCGHIWQLRDSIFL